MKRLFYIQLVLIVFSFSKTYSQTQWNPSYKEFSVKVNVIDDNTKEPIRNAEVTVNGKKFNFSNITGKYTVRTSLNQELIVTHPDFHAVHHTIRSNEEVTILVRGFEDKKSKYSFDKLSVSKGNSKRKRESNTFNTYYDSVKFYNEKNLNKSLTFVEEMLVESNTKRRKAASFKELAKIYAYWKQYDLAIENYQASLNEYYDYSVLLLLAQTQALAVKNGDAKRSFLRVVKKKELSIYEQLLAYEGLGSVYLSLQDYNKAKKSFMKALEIARKSLLQSKITDLNSKLAETYAKLGEERKADSLFTNSLDLAFKENVRRSLNQQEKVADYYNQAQRYDDEIDLRKESLKDAEEITIETDDKESLVDSITSQKINYKIGNAYILKQEYDEAIPYLKKSIEEADKNEDLVVQKDATRKLSEALETVGNYIEALEAYQSYVQLVDTLYSRKEQEIQQLKRFGKRIADNQSRIKSLEKDKELANTKVDLAYKDQQLVQESNKRQEYIIYSLIGGMLLMVLVAYFMFRTNKQQKFANNLLALKSMRSQMNPHFIFNALNSVNSFIAVNDERSANRYLSEFSVLMRSVLENSDEDFIPLSKEIELLELYVKLEHNRFQDKFDYVITIDDKIRLEDYSIPPMLLQPYIENAIWHGLRYKEQKGNLHISMSQKSDDSIKILIEDDGVGRKKSMEMKTKNQLKQKSKGMSTIQNRIGILNDMYQDKIEVLVTDVHEDGSGTKVELILKKD